MCIEMSRNSNLISVFTFTAHKLSHAFVLIFTSNTFEHKSIRIMLKKGIHATL